MVPSLKITSNVFPTFRLNCTGNFSGRSSPGDETTSVYAPRRIFVLSNMPDNCLLTLAHVSGEIPYSDSMNISNTWLFVFPRKTTSTSVNCSASTIEATSARISSRTLFTITLNYLALHLGTALLQKKSPELRDFLRGAFTIYRSYPSIATSKYIAVILDNYIISFIFTN